MREHDFTVTAPFGDTLNDEDIELMLDLVADAVFVRYEGDVIPATRNGELVLECTVEASDADKAAAEVWEVVLSAIREGRQQLERHAEVLGSYKDGNNAVATALAHVDPIVSRHLSAMTNA